MYSELESTTAQGRTAAATHGAKDLLSFVKGNAEMEDMAAKNFARFSALFGQETGSANDALLGYSSSCKSMQKLHADLQNMLASVEVKRSEEALAAVEEASKKLNAQGAQLVSDLGSSRDKLDKALAAQEKAWADCIDAESKDKALSSADSDPWIAALRYQAASKGLETVYPSKVVAIQKCRLYEAVLQAMCVCVCECVCVCVCVCARARACVRA